MRADSPPATQRHPTPFTIAGWRVDPGAYRLQRDGEETRIEPKAMQVLQYLAERPGRVVSRQELERVIWSGTVVGYEAVTNAVIKLRKALRDDARDPHIIETISKGGYRLIADIETQPEDTLSQAGKVGRPAQANRITAATEQGRERRRFNRPLAAVAATVLGIAIGAGAWFYHQRPDAEAASVDNMAFPLPKEPSIAVLPFDNLSGDAEQEYLADGLTEDIITALAKSPYLFVIARNSTLKYKGKPVSVKQVAEDVGVRHVLEGSVQRSGERIRITAQLIDALTGRHIWAEHYDREFADIFALQDEITGRIMVALHVEITEGYDYSDLRARVRTPEAFELLMKARVLGLRNDKEDSAISRQLVAQAAVIEPDNPEIWLYQAWGHWRQYQNRWSEDRQASFDKAVELGENAYAEVPDYSAAVGFLGVLSLSRGEHEKAIAYGRESVRLAPGSALDKARLAWFLTVSGHPEEAIALTQKAMRLSPSYPAWFASVLGFSYMITGRHREAITLYEQLVERETQLLNAHTRLAINHAVLGEAEKAGANLAKALEIKPDLTVQGWKEFLQYRYPEDQERELDILRMVGLPEGGNQ